MADIKFVLCRPNMVMQYESSENVCAMSHASGVYFRNITCVLIVKKSQARGLVLYRGTTLTGVFVPETLDFSVFCSRYERV